MIQAKDLRIGNLCFRKGKKIVTIENIYGPSGVVDVKDESNFRENRIPIPSYISGIPITEEWLLKFGFDPQLLSNIFLKKMQVVGGVTLKSIAVYLQENECTIALVDYYTGTEKTELLHMEYQYVHQLQNLYFALTGQELEIK